MNLLQKLAQGNLTGWGEKALGSFYVAALGMALTFLILGLIMVLVWAFSKVLGGGVKAAPAEPPVLMPVPPPPSPQPEEEDGELVAALAAAAWTVLGAPARIVTFRRRRTGEEDTPAWGRLGRIQQLKGGTPRS